MKRAMADRLKTMSRLSPAHTKGYILKGLSKSPGNFSQSTDKLSRYDLFRLIHHRVIPEFMYSSTARYAIVTILPEIVLPDPIFGNDSNSLSRLRSNESCRKKVIQYETGAMAWPLFVYDMYNMDKVIEKIKSFLAKMKIGGRILIAAKIFFCCLLDASCLAFLINMHLFI